MDREIGQGEFGVVMRALMATPKSGTVPIPVAVKMLKASSHAAEATNQFIREGLRSKPLNHENVIKLLGVCLSSDPLFLVFEFMPNGDLKTLLRIFCSEASLKSAITTDHMLKLSADVLNGFSYLQREGYVHRDIAARNVLINDAFTAKLGDFGLIIKIQLF
jgi:c-src tyrosine kinase